MPFLDKTATLYALVFEILGDEIQLSTFSNKVDMPKIRNSVLTDSAATLISLNNLRKQRRRRGGSQRPSEEFKACKVFSC